MSCRFVANYDESQSKAYRTLLKDMMENSAILIEGGIFTGKEVLDKLEDLQAHLKGGDEGKTSPADELNLWLNKEAITQ